MFIIYHLWFKEIYIYIYVHKQLTVTSISNDIPLLLLLVYHINNTTTGFELTLLRLHDLIGFVYIRDAKPARSIVPSIVDEVEPLRNRTICNLPPTGGWNSWWKRINIYTYIYIYIYIRQMPGFCPDPQWRQATHHHHHHHHHHHQN